MRLFLRLPGKRRLSNVLAQDGRVLMTRPRGVHIIDDVKASGGVAAQPKAWHSAAIDIFRTSSSKSQGQFPLDTPAI